VTKGGVIVKQTTTPSADNNSLSVIRVRLLTQKYIPRTGQ
jgi:hypothetical protein